MNRTTLTLWVAIMSAFAIALTVAGIVTGQVFLAVFGVVLLGLQLVKLFVWR